MTETEFIDSIDCQFPYHSEGECRAIIERGSRISPNAAFMVLHELCRLPSDIHVEPALMLSMLKHWQRHFTHPLVEVTLRAAKTMIEGRKLPVEESMGIMKIISAYPDQYNALAITYFSCDDTEGKVEKLYEEIIADWQNV